MFGSGVTRHAGVLRICVAVLRDVTVLAPVEPWSLGYELAIPGFLESPASQTYRSGAVTGPISAAGYHAISSVAPRFVHKSVHNTLPRASPSTPLLRASLMPTSARTHNRCAWAFAASASVGAFGVYRF